MKREEYIATLPEKPYCVAVLGQRLRIRDAKSAISYPIIQHNAPLCWRWMVFDVDGTDAYDRADDRGCPKPTYIAINPKNGHAHIGYLLQSPVSAFERSSRRAMNYYADVERGLTHRLGADIAYPGFLTKNPISAAWAVDWQAQVPYLLDSLNDCLDKHDKRRRPRQEVNGAGRNCSLFDTLRPIAYKQWRAFHKAGKSLEEFEHMLKSTAASTNSTFPVPLNQVEANSIARSVARWVWKKFSEQGFSALQSARGKRSWSKTPTLAATKPWEALGVSRRTWYRHFGTKAISG